MRTFQYRRTLTVTVGLLLSLLLAATATTSTAESASAQRNAGTGTTQPEAGTGTAQPEAGTGTAQPTEAKNVAVGVTVRTQMTDVDDTDGRLDVRAVGHRLRQTTPDRVRITYHVTTFSRYRDGLLESPTREFVLELHRTSTRGADRNITVSSENGRLVARVISNATREPIGVARISRLSPRTIAISGSRQLIGARSYFLTSNFHLGGSRRCGWRDGWPVTCQDSVPDDGWLRVHRMAWPITG